MQLPLIRLCQAQSQAVIRGLAQPGQWIIYRGKEAPLVLDRFKALIVNRRQTAHKYDDGNFSILRGKDAQSPPRGYRLGAEFMLWLPHYKMMVLMSVTASTSFRVMVNLGSGQLIGFSSERRTAHFDFYVPVAAELDLPVDLQAIGGEFLLDAQLNFEKGLDLTEGNVIVEA